VPPPNGPFWPNDPYAFVSPYMTPPGAVGSYKSTPAFKGAALGGICSVCGLCCEDAHKTVCAMCKCGTITHTYKYGERPTVEETKTFKDVTCVVGDGSWRKVHRWGDRGGVGDPKFEYDPKEWRLDVTLTRRKREFVPGYYRALGVIVDLSAYTDWPPGWSALTRRDAKRLIVTEVDDDWQG